MFAFDIKVNAKILPVWTPADKKALGRATAKYVERHMIPLMERRMNRELMALPGRPKYPIRWASEKQRKFVMAKLRAQNNLPYRRTGKLARRWQLLAALRLEAGTITIENPADIAQYIYGDRVGRHQQPFHKDTGWALASAFFEKLYITAGDQLMAAWPDILEIILKG